MNLFAIMAKIISSHYKSGRATVGIESYMSGAVIVESYGSAKNLRFDKNTIILTI